MTASPLSRFTVNPQNTHKKGTMKFTVARTDLKNLLKAVVSRGRRAHTFTLSACAARVFAECKGDVAGIEALVFGDGAVTLPAAGRFRNLLKTYKGRRFLTIEGSPDGLQIENFRMRVLSYNPSPKPPADFQVFPVTAPPSCTMNQQNRTHIR
jgi:hypothetical protein